MRQRGRLDNFGIRQVERLDGNVGYLDVRRVAVPANAGPAITAAMELVAGTYALVIDLRHNGGGSPEGVVFWCSYLLDERPTHLNDIFHADTGETRQFWGLPYVPGTRYLDRPVYVLTSHHTFSGGEDFAYTLQALGRATVVGETTGGGAHPTRGFPISAAVHIGIPFARSVNPVTGTNWQGTGVVPDVAVPEAQACDVAYTRALEHVLAMEDVPPPIEDEAREALSALLGSSLSRWRFLAGQPLGDDNVRRRFLVFWVHERPPGSVPSGIALIGPGARHRRGRAASRAVTAAKGSLPELPSWHDPPPRRGRAAHPERVIRGPGPAAGGYGVSARRAGDSPTAAGRRTALGQRARRRSARIPRRRAGRSASSRGRASRSSRARPAPARARRRS
jgi:hypothetical protein